LNQANEKNPQSDFRRYFPDRCQLVHAAWPDRQITLVVPFPAGGGTDIVGRIIAKELAQRLRVNVVVENRPGASGNIGARQVSKARPDGYTLLICSTAQTISGALYTQAGYDVVNDLEAISTINDGPLCSSHARA
jgi:tripartite-type tricarboxylate transporter receptor subunit TctC